MKIKAYEDPQNFKTNFLLYTDKGNGEVYTVAPVDALLVRMQDGKEVKPTFSIQNSDAREFIKSMAELAEKMGIKTDSQIAEETRNKGVLDATKYHLEDMRKLVFLEPKIINEHI